MSSVRHIIWDWNGTLFDDSQLTLDVLNEILIGDNLSPISLEDFRTRFKFPVTLFYEELGYKAEDSRLQAMGSWFAEYERRKVNCQLFSDVRPALEEAQLRNVSHSILSAHDHAALLEGLEQVGISQFFRYVVGAHGSNRGMTKVQTGQELCRKLENEHQISAQQLLMIGDSSHDFEVAEALGIPCILVARGVMSGDRLRKFGVPVADSIAEALKLVDTM